MKPRFFATPADFRAWLGYGDLPVGAQTIKTDSAGLTAGEVATRFGYSPASVHQMASELRTGSAQYFRSSKPGPRSARTGRATEAVREHIAKPLDEISFCYLGDARFNMGNSYLVTGALLGMPLLPDYLEEGLDRLGYSVEEMEGGRFDRLLAWYERRGYALTGERRPFPSRDPRFGRPRRDDLEFVVLEKRL